MTARRDGKTTRYASFNAFFRNQLLPTLEKLERERRRRLPLLLVACGVCVAVVAAILIRGSHFSRFILLPFLLVSGYTSVVSMNAYFRYDRMLKRKSMRLKTPTLLPDEGPFGRSRLGVLARSFLYMSPQRLTFSKEVVAKTVDYALPGLDSRPAEYMGQGDFLESRLFGYHYNVYRGTDFFHGWRNRLNYTFSWLKVEYVPKSKGDQSYRLVFSGWFFAVFFPRRFQGETVAYADVAEAKLGWLGRSLQGVAITDGYELIHLEDPDFERHFKVVSSGQLESRFILSPGFMRTAAAVRKRVAKPMAFSFRRNCMYVAFPRREEYFTPLSTTPFTSPYFTRHLYHATRGVREMAEHVAQNHLLWGES